MAVVPAARQQAEGLPFSANFAAIMARVLTASVAWAIVGAQVFRPTLRLMSFSLVFFLCVGAVMWAAKVRGSRVFARTPIDIVFVIWLGLAVLSQLYGSLGLYRVLFLDDLRKYMTIILSTWAVYRAGFALCCVDRKTAIGAFLKAILFFLGAACLLGILQGYGPGPLKSFAIEFSNTYGMAGEGVETALSLSSPRPIAMFSGPNIFGFVNLIAMCVIIGLTVAQGRAMSTISVVMASLGLFLFTLGTLAAQSRFAVVTAGLLIVYFFYLMLRTGRRTVLISGVVAVGAIVIGSLFVAQSLELGYLESTFERRLTDDNSFRLRRAGFDSLIDQAPDLAFLGAGFNSRSFSIDRTGDRWEQTNSIDNGYLQAFITHGIPGLLHFAFYLGACWWGIRMAKPYPWTHIKTLRVVAGLVFATYVIYSVSGVRHAKHETAFYWMLIFGLLYAAIYQERWEAARHRLAASPQPETPQVAARASA